MGLPAIIRVHDIRLLTGWSRQRVQGYMDRNGLTRRGPDGIRFTTPSIIESVMPDALVAMERKWDALAAGRDFDPDRFDDLDEDAA